MEVLMKRVLLFGCVLFAISPAFATPQPVNLLQFQTTDVAAWEQATRTSASRPMRLSDIEKLRAAGIKETVLIELMRTRKLLTLASPETLIELKRAGASDAVIAAVSAYALPPNDRIRMLIQLNLISPNTLADAPFLYIEAWHTVKKRQVAFFHADLRRLITNAKRVKIIQDRADPLIPETVAAIRFLTDIESQFPGTIELRIMMNRQAALTTLSDSKGLAIKGTVTRSIPYPAVSIRSACRLDLTARRDNLMPEMYQLGEPRLDCRWD